MTHQYGSLREKIAAESKARKERYAQFKALIEKADAAGLAAGKAAVPRVMVVTNPATGQVWHESEGLCGFAWVHIPDGKSSFAKWATKNNVAGKSYRGGVDVWCHHFNQSVARKEAWARAYAEVLNEGGIKAYSGSRLD